MAERRGAPTLPPEERASSHLHLRVTQKDKAGWVKAAQREGVKLSQWVINLLNDEVKK